MASEIESGLSLGPLHLSDLGPPAASESRGLPRRLEPITPVKQEKRRRKKRTKRTPAQRGEPTGDTATGEPSLPPDDEPLMGESALSQLRARLDPLYNPPPPPMPPPLDLSGTTGGGSNGTDATDQQTREDGEEQPSVTKPTKHRRPKKGRRKERESESAGDDPVNSVRQPPEGEPTEARAPTEDRTWEVPPQADDSLPGPSQSTRQGRQLPALPVDVDTSTGPTVAEQLAIAGEQTRSIQATSFSGYSQPDDPQYLVSGEDLEGPGDPPTAAVADESGPTPYPLPSVRQPTSHPRDVIFVERKDGRGFITRRKSQQEESTGGRRDEEGAREGERDISSAEFALHAHKSIQTLALGAHGLVAGISLWDCIVSNILSQQSSRHLDLLQSYNRLTLPVHAVYVFLLSLVFLSLLDRFDFAGLSRQCLETFTRAPSQIILFVVSVLVFLALVVTLSVAAIDERIALYPDQPSLWSDVLTSINTTTLSPVDTIPLPTTHTEGTLVYLPGSSLVSSRVTSWLALAIVRAVCCCASWIMAVWISSYDRLDDYLLNMARDSEIKQRN